jgi:hypothetical protein
MEHGKDTRLFSFFSYRALRPEGLATTLYFTEGMTWHRDIRMRKFMLLHYHDPLLLSKVITFCEFLTSALHVKSLLSIVCLMSTIGIGTWRREIRSVTAAYWKGYTVRNELDDIFTKIIP